MQMAMWMRPFLEFSQHVLEILCLRDVEGLSHHGRQRRGLRLGVYQVFQQVLGMDHADDVVPVLPVDGNAGMPFFYDEARYLGEAVLLVGTHDVRARHHDVRHLFLSEFQEFEQHGGVIVSDLSIFLGRLDQFLKRQVVSTSKEFVDQGPESSFRSIFQLRPPERAISVIKRPALYNAFVTVQFQMQLICPVVEVADAEIPV